jgi:hypothetical protein
MEIKASYEADRMLGSGEVVGRRLSCVMEVLNHGDVPFGECFAPRSRTCTNMS